MIVVNNTMERTTTYKINFKEDTVKESQFQTEEEKIKQKNEVNGSNFLKSRNNSEGKESSEDSLFQDESESEYAEKEIPKPKKIGFKLFKCAKNIQDKKKKITPVRLQSPGVDKFVRRRVKGFINFSSQMNRQDFIEQSKVKINDARLESSLNTQINNH
mmetsp:Transcript_5448/g.4621  ORF Transcript_5448/g.4621 Transcript_5448/m.4621 type:complete len:159 (+) Transcript_5448:401-877(+)